MSLRIAPVGPGQTSAFGDIWVPWLEATIGRAPEPEDLRARFSSLRNCVTTCSLERAFQTFFRREI